MRLYIVRHGDALDESLDSQRPLSESGHTDAALVAAFLSIQSPLPTAVWHSPKLRAQQTAEAIHGALSPKTRIEPREGMAPNDDPERFIASLQTLHSPLCIVGHAPWVGVLSAKLITTHPVHDMWKFPTCGALCLDSDRPGHWWVQWFVTPALLRSVAPDRNPV